MECRLSRDGPIVVIEVEGRIDTSSVGLLENVVATEVAEADEVVICDLQNVAYVSSAGLRTMNILGKGFSKKGVTFLLCNLCADVHEVFHSSGFHRILQIVDTREEAFALVSRFTEQT